MDSISSTSKILTIFFNDEESSFLGDQQLKWLNESIQLEYIDADGYISRTVFAEIDSVGKVTAKSIKLFNFLQIDLFEFSKYFIDFAQSGAALIAGLKIQEPILAICGVLKLVWDFKGSSAIKFSDFDAEVLYTLYLIGYEGKIADVPAKYQELFNKPIEPSHLEKALTLLDDYHTIERPDAESYRLIETIHLRRA